MNVRRGALSVAALLALTPVAWAGPPDPARELADRIDKHVRAGWEQGKVTPAPLADDAEFLRRVHLQLAGRVPSVSEVREFLADKKDDKRERVVRKLLDSPRYVVHFLNVWRGWMMPEAEASIQARFLIPGFENWLRGNLKDNTPYDRMVHELLTAPINGTRGGGFFGVGGTPEGSPASYFLAKELKPENVGAATARLFLGIRLECAQCHDHPFAEWKREQFWQYAAFFSGVRGQNQGDFIAPSAEKSAQRTITIGGTEKVVTARFPDGRDPKFKDKEPTRKTLADWVVAADNPYFARATVNRLWDHFFGVGLIDPMDEMVGVDSTASHPELLDELARAFVANRYDLKILIRGIVLSKAYQLSSRKTDPSQNDARKFARYPLRGMSAEQLFDSVSMATGYQEYNPYGQGVFFGGPSSSRQEFITRFGEQSGKATEAQTSILQALALMNGKLIENATSLDRSETLAAVVDNPFMSMEDRIETLYLATLSRKPNDRELKRMQAFVEEAVAEKRGGHVPPAPRAPGPVAPMVLPPRVGPPPPPPGMPPQPMKPDEMKRRQALADIFWSLLNSSEFVLNH